MPTPPAVPAGVLRAPGELLDRIRRDAERNALRARNGIRRVGHAVLPRPEGTARELAWSDGRARLWRHRGDGPPVLLVASLIGGPAVLDLAPGDSLVARLAQEGYAVHVLEWTEADASHAGETLETYVDGHLPAALAAAGGGAAAHVVGYAFGGVLALLHAAHHPGAPLRTLTTIAAPVDFTGWPVWQHLAREVRRSPTAVVDTTGNVPASVMREAFRQVKPAGAGRDYAVLLAELETDDHEAAYRALTAWADQHVPFPGAAARQTLAQLVDANGLVDGGVTLGGDTVRLADVRVPALTVLAEHDNVVPAAVTEVLPDLLGSAERELLRVDGGHVALVAGPTAAVVTVPRLLAFLRRHDP